MPFLERRSLITTPRAPPSPSFKQSPFPTPYLHSIKYIPSPVTHQDSLRDSSLLNAIHEIGPHMDNIPLPWAGTKEGRKGGFNAGINIRHCRHARVSPGGGGGWVAVELSLSLIREMTKERGVVPRIDVCAPALQESPSPSPRPSPPLPLLGGSYTNFQECLPPHPSNLLSSALHSPPPLLLHLAGWLLEFPWQPGGGPLHIIPCV